MKSKKTTIKQAKAELKPLNMTLNKNQYDEYRVGFRGCTEAECYRTNDIDDAVATAKHMFAREAEKGGRQS